MSSEHVVDGAGASEKLILMNQEKDELEIECKVVEVDDDWLEGKDRDEERSPEIVKSVQARRRPGEAEAVLGENAAGSEGLDLPASGDGGGLSERRGEGSVQIIKLDSVREALGSQWLEIEARGMRLAKATLQGQLKPADRLSLTSEGSFEIFFSELSDEEAALKARNLAKLVHTKLLDQQEVFDPQFNDPTDGPSSEADRLLQELRAQARVGLANVIANANRRMVNLRLVSLGRQWASKIDNLRRVSTDEATAEFKIDLMLLGLAVDQLASPSLPAGDRLAVPIQYRNLVEPPLATKFIECCRDIPEDLRDRLILNLTGLDSHDMLSPWAETAYECYSRLRMIQIRELFLPIDLAAERISIVNIEFGDLEAHLWSGQERIRTLIREVQAANCRFLISEVPSEHLTLARMVRPDLLSLRGEAVGRF